MLSCQGKYSSFVLATPNISCGPPSIRAAGLETARKTCSKICTHHRSSLNTLPQGTATTATLGNQIHIAHLFRFATTAVPNKGKTNPASRRRHQNQHRFSNDLSQKDYGTRSRINHHHLGPWTNSFREGRQEAAITLERVLLISVRIQGIPYWRVPHEKQNRKYTKNHLRRPLTQEFRRGFARGKDLSVAHQLHLSIEDSVINGGCLMLHPQIIARHLCCS